MNTTKVIFTTSNKLLSRIIRYVTGSEFSHVALLIDKNFILHSSVNQGVRISAGQFQNRTGVNLMSKDDFLDHGNTIVHSIDVTNRMTHRVMDDIIPCVTAKKSIYDTPALIFLGIAMLAHKFLGTPMPRKNYWQSSGAMMCTEFVTQHVFGEVDSLITPQELYEKLKD